MPGLGGRAFLLAGGASFHEAFGHEDKTEVLRSFRDEAADDLAPVGFDVHLEVNEDPDDAGEGEEDGERVVVRETADVG
jgi:hypothetical protein